MQFYIYYIQDFLCKQFHIKIKNLNLKEPFKGLFTQGMVCHETYKDENNNWISPDEIETIDGKKYLKKNKSKKIKLVHQNQCQNQKKIQLILKK